jgi:hypothetical protein
MGKEDELYNRMIILMIKKRAYSFLTYAPDFAELETELRNEIKISGDTEFNAKGEEILREIDQLVFTGVRKVNIPAYSSCNI